MKILVGIPRTSYTLIATFPHVANMLLRTQKNHPDWTIEVRSTRRQGIYLVHRQLTNYALRHKFDHLLFLEEDVIPPLDALEKLIAHDLNIVCGVYWNRSYPHTPNVFIYDPTKGTDVPYYDLPKNMLVEASFCGLGCALFKCAALADIGPENFAYDGEATDDRPFLRKAREKGYRVFVDTSVTCAHLDDHFPDTADEFEKIEYTQDVIGEVDFTRAMRELKEKHTWVSPTLQKEEKR